MTLHRGMLLGFSLLVVTSGTAFAQKTWNVTNGNWSTAGNWNPGSVPATNDDVVIANGGTATLDNNGVFNTLMIGSGSKIQHTNTAGCYLRASSTVAPQITNAGIVTTSGNVGLELRHQLSNYLLTIDNTGGTISATGSGLLRLIDDPYLIAGGQIDIGTGSRLDQYRDMTLTNVVVVNSGTWNSKSENNEASSSVTLDGTTSFNNAGMLTITNGGNLTADPPRHTRLVVNSTASLTNAAAGVINITRNQAATNNVKNHQAYLEMNATGFNNQGAINIVSFTGQVGTAQFRSSVDFSNAGTITVDGPQSSVQMTNRTLTQAAGALDVKNGGCVVATNVLINGGTLAGNGSITGNVTLATSATRAWSYTNGVAGAMNIAGTLTLPAAATVAVSGSGDFPNPATVFTASALAGDGSLSGWTVTGVSGYRAKIDGNSVVLVKSAGYVLHIR